MPQKGTGLTPQQQHDRMRGTGAGLRANKETLLGQALEFATQTGQDVFEVLKAMVGAGGRAAGQGVSAAGTGILNAAQQLFAPTPPLSQIASETHEGIRGEGDFPGQRARGTAPVGQVTLTGPGGEVLDYFEEGGAIYVGHPGALGTATAERVVDAQEQRRVREALKKKQQELDAQRTRDDARGSVLTRGAGQ